jgi:hypothetical protein
MPHCLEKQAQLDAVAKTVQRSFAALKKKLRPHAGRRFGDLCCLLGVRYPGRYVERRKEAVDVIRASGYAINT